MRQLSFPPAAKPRRCNLCGVPLRGASKLQFSMLFNYILSRIDPAYLSELAEAHLGQKGVILNKPGDGWGAAFASDGRADAG